MGVLAEGIIGYLLIGAAAMVLWTRSRRNRAHAAVLARATLEPANRLEIAAEALAFWRWRQAARASWIALGVCVVACLPINSYPWAGAALALAAAAWWGLRIRRVWGEGIPEAKPEPIGRA